MIPFHIPTPQGCDIQTFYGFGTNVGNSSQRTWNKPVGVSHVYIMCIGSGGNGTGTSSGGSGAVTVWYGAAQHVPNTLYVVATGQGSQAGSQIYFDTRQVYNLLTAEGGFGGTAGVATPANEFAASGFFQSTAGQAGVTTGVPVASATTFLSAGGSSTGSSPTPNYGYDTPGVSNGFFMTQPIIVGKGASGTTAASNTGAAYGCGASAGATRVGGPGLILIASW